MPELSNHFETLDITADLFLIDWMLTLYSKILPVDLASRIWDNFFLDGEIFAMKTALALIQYRESQLTNQSYYKIIKVLRGNSNEEEMIDEERLFRLIDAVDIDKDEYYADLKMQKWSYQKSKILGGVFR